MFIILIVNNDTLIGYNLNSYTYYFYKSELRAKICFTEKAK